MDLEGELRKLVAKCDLSTTTMKEIRSQVRQNLPDPPVTQTPPHGMRCHLLARVSTRRGQLEAPQGRNQGVSYHDSPGAAGRRGFERRR